MRHTLKLLFLFCLLTLFLLPASAAAGEQEQLDVLFASQNDWMEGDEALIGDIWYAVTDLDANGRLEILRGSQLGRRIGYPVSVFEVREDLSGVEELSFQQGADAICPDLVTDWISAITDGTQYRYFIYEQWGDPVGGGTKSGLMWLENGEVHTEKISEMSYWSAETPYASIPQGVFNEAGDDFYESYSDWEYADFNLGWRNLRETDDISEFLTVSWNLFCDREDTWPQRDSSGPASGMAYFDTPESGYHDFDGEVMQIKTGFEDFGDENVRITVNSDGMTLRLEALDFAQISEYSNGYVPAYEIFSFTPMPGKVYEIPYDIYNGIGLCRLVLTDREGNRAELDSFVHYEDGSAMRYDTYALVCQPPKNTLSGYEDIISLSQSFAGWYLDLQRGEESPASFYWDTAANAIAWNMSSFTSPDANGCYQLPAWVVDQYTAALFGFIEWEWDYTPLDGDTPIQTREEAPDFLFAAADQRYSDRNIRVNAYLQEGDDGFIPGLGDLALQIIISEGEWEESVIVFLTRMENMFGWCISAAVVSLG